MLFGGGLRVLELLVSQAESVVEERRVLLKHVRAFSERKVTLGKLPWQSC